MQQTIRTLYTLSLVFLVASILLVAYLVLEPLDDSDTVNPLLLVGLGLLALAILSVIGAMTLKTINGIREIRSRSRAGRTPLGSTPSARIPANALPEERSTPSGGLGE